VIARWISVRPLGVKIARLTGGAARVTLHAVHDVPRATELPDPTVAGAPGARSEIDPHEACAEVRIGGVSIVVAGSSRAVRGLAQRLLGGPPEHEAPRPLTVAEQAIWALALATAIEDTGIVADVWPLAELSPELARDGIRIELEVDLAGSAITVIALCPPGLELRVPPPRDLPTWMFDVPVVLGACALPRESLSRLALRDVITLGGGLALAIGQGTIALHAAAGAVEANVTTGYVPRDMTLPDEAHVELTVQLGTTRLTLRQLGELAPGTIVQLGRPLAGPFEVRAAGRPIGQGELVDVDGELGVRIVSLQE
jgi:flagellar motor switch/type III secretory pathway protein FliN